MTKLRNAGMKTFVIDLRDNGGGYVETAVKIADELLINKKLIVFTKNKRNEIQKSIATDVGDFEEGKVFILINENSASASEILAGAIQDNDRGTIVGRRSFGKGLVQQEMNFDDGSAVRLTIARYYTPTGRSIQKTYIKGNEEAYANDFYERFQSGELYEKDSIKVADTLKFKTPKGKMVYGGGGIVPDVFISLEGKQGEGSIAYLMQQSGFVGQFVFEQLDKYRLNFKVLTFEKFLVEMNRNEMYYTNFQNYLSQNGIEFNLSKSKPLVKRYLSAEFARQLYDEEKYYEIVLKQDPMIQAVLSSKF
jgi:carboxyl-terminal processing protease